MNFPVILVCLRVIDFFVNQKVFKFFWQLSFECLTAYTCTFCHSVILIILTHMAPQKNGLQIILNLKLYIPRLKSDNYFGCFLQIIMPLIQYLLVKTLFHVSNCLASIFLFLNNFWALKKICLICVIFLIFLADTHFTPLGHLKVRPTFIPSKIILQMQNTDYLIKGRSCH